MNIKISRTCDDSFLSELAESLEKNAVQPVRTDNSLFNQINDIMNGGAKSKFSSVSEVVEDMKARAGLTAYLEKLSENNNSSKVSVAEDNFTTNINKIHQTADNIITSTKGGLSVHAILDKLKSLHVEDCDQNFWEDPRLLDYLAKKNLSEKGKYPSSLENESNIGKITPNNELNQWDSDYFYGINA